MATKIYDTAKISLVNGEEITLTPLKIKYLREFMSAFELVKDAKDDNEAISLLAECARVTMQQYYPKIKTIEDLEDNIDLPSIYKILDIAAGIKVNAKSDKSVKKQATDSGTTWDTLDLAKLESETFLLGIWKDYEELETSLSMPEMLATLEIKRELDYSEKKFLAAIQGVDLDKQSNKSNAWEELKARVFSKGKATDSKDIMALQGVNAQQAGFGIGMGIDYQEIVD
ncbi:MAG: hypothetical protein EBV27_00155 [Actinobacteria bacterium]|jgi:hypothetical protein|nr:hypothetical protein [Actinomycetota bacterium]